MTIRRAPIAVLHFIALSFASTFLAVAANPPSPEVIKQTVQNVLANGPYSLSSSDYYAFNFGWLVDLIGRFLGLFIDAFGAASYPVALLITISLIAILVALLAHIMYSMYTALRVTQSPTMGLESTALPNADALERDAERFVAEGNYVDASRTLLRAALVRLERKRGGRVLLAFTNREYLETFRSPWVIQNLKVFMELINWKWYRDRQFDQGDYAQCREAYNAILAHLEQNA